MEGKIRVSIVATSLDGHKPESKTVLNMVNRIHNRTQVILKICLKIQI